MFKYIYRRLLIGYMLVTEPFKKTARKTLEEKIFHQLHEGQPIFVLHENVYYVLLNNWLGEELLLERLEIFVAASPNGHFQQVPFKKANGFLQLEIPVETTRIFIKLAYHEQSVIIGERLLDMKGTVNFRDVGGYQVNEHQQVAWNRIFRSGHLNKLSKSERNYFKSLSIRSIVDFRGQTMSKRFPDKVADTENVQFTSLPIESKGLEMRKVGMKILKNDLADFDARSILNRSYKEFILIHTKEAKRVLDIFLNTEGSVLIHCTAGKDRTGFFIALLLRILGVPLDVIRKDFIASNFYRKKENDRLYNNAKAFADAAPLLPLINVQAEYLETAFNTIDREFGSLENYLEEALGVKEQYIQTLRDKYLIQV